MNKTMFGSFPYIPGKPPTKPELLARHLPPIPEGVVSTWLKMNVPQGAWVLDPFGSSPRTALEAAQAGYRVLVAANNPIVRFLLEMQAAPPNMDELRSALSELAASYVGDERIEPHIRSLYNTLCARCGQTISAEAFLWEHGNPTPYARVYTCPYCGDAGEHPCTAYDATQTAKITSTGLHKARALERVVPYNDPDRIHVEQALSVYTPRALYALITLINKLQGMDISPEGRKYLSALLLFTFDQANSMWRPQAQGDHRRHLTIPRHSKETNVWCALEEGMNQWSTGSMTGAGSTVPVFIWPNVPTGAHGLCIFEGRLINLIDSIKNIDIDSLCTAIPRPNQAYWTLSALWAGWLWGREAVGAFKSVLHRQRYDWAWHANALCSVFKQLASSLRPSTTIFGLIGEAEPGFIGSALVAAGVAGCRLESIAQRSEEKLAQIIWKTEQGHEITYLSDISTQAASQSAKRYLQYCGEPESYLDTISAALAGIVNQWGTEPVDGSIDKATSIMIPAEAHQAAAQDEPAPSRLYSSTFNSAREALSYRSGFLRYNILGEAILEASAGNQATQATLFSEEVGKNIDQDDETLETDVLPAESEASVEKDKPTRSSDVPESAVFWLRETNEVNHLTLSDNYEASLVKFLTDHPALTLAEIDQALCGEFTGLFTPDSNFFRLCLASYAQPDPKNPDRWILRPEDQPTERHADLIQIKEDISRIGERLAFDPIERTTSLSAPHIVWQDHISGEEFWFFITLTSAIGEFVIHGEQPPPGRGYVVFPGSRTNLIIYKLRRDPRLNKAFNPSQGSWQFLKFRHLRSLAESPLLSRANLDQMLNLDPLTFSTPQLWLV